MQQPAIGERDEPLMQHGVCRPFPVFSCKGARGSASRTFLQAARGIQPCRSAVTGEIVALHSTSCLHAEAPFSSRSSVLPWPPQPSRSHPRRNPLAAR